MNQADLTEILEYHRQSKHAPGRYARSAGFMDWPNQPNPFRIYRGSAITALPLDCADPTGDALALYRHGPAPAWPLNLAAVGKLLELSFGLSAWKAMGDSRWALRMNPSSGNLHPTEVHLLLPPTAGGSGLFHYCALTHVLERRATLDAALWPELERDCGGPGLLLGLATIHWRESWKYGERAFRYCQLDIGHALAALAFAANLLGWRVRLVGDITAQQVERLFGLDRDDYDPLEKECADLACWVGPATQAPAAAHLSAPLEATLAALELCGQPNRLSPSAVDWQWIAHASRCSAGALPCEPLPEPGPEKLLESAGLGLAAAAIVRRRRSARDYDPRGRIALAQFRALLDRTLPRRDAAPFDIGLGKPAIQLLLFVHRVEDLAPGLYLLLRQGAPDELSGLFDPQFSWQRLAPDLPLFRLREGDLRRLAAHLSCDQAIAGDSAFSLGMLADFERLKQQGAAAYRRLYWEAGLIGQALYLEAEAQGLRGTGIGCFFDDAVSEVAGLSHERLQSIYHFTVGHPLEDANQLTLPPYHDVEPLRRQVHAA